MDWTVILKASLSFFLVVTALALAYALLRAGTTFTRLNDFLKRLDEEIIPLLSKMQVTMDEVNTQLGKTDDMLDSIVDVTDKVESTTRALSSAINTPVKKIAGLSAGMSEALSSFLSGLRRGS